MTITLELTAEQEAKLIAAAHQEGLQPAEMITKLVAEYLPALSGDEQARRALAMQELVKETERLGLYR